MAYNKTVGGEKRCSRCERSFPRTAEYWHHNRTQNDGLANYCKECRCALSRTYTARRRAGHPNPPRKQPEERFNYRAWHRVVRMELLIAYSQDPPSCACCGETTYEFLSIDHVNGDGHKVRAQFRRDAMTELRYLRRAGYPNKEAYQVLCHNCNHSLGCYGFCPHRPEVTRPVALVGQRVGRRKIAASGAATAVHNVVEESAS